MVKRRVVTTVGRRDARLRLGICVMYVVVCPFRL